MTKVLSSREKIDDAPAMNAADDNFVTVFFISRKNEVYILCESFACRKFI